MTPKGVIAEQMLSEGFEPVDRVEGAAANVLAALDRAGFMITPKPQPLRPGDPLTPVAVLDHAIASVGDGNFMVDLNPDIDGIVITGVYLVEWRDEIRRLAEELEACRSSAGVVLAGTEYATGGTR